jgi:hypothetical protein
MDRGWWKQTVDEVDQVFSGERFTRGALPARFRTKQADMQHYNNSGAAAISLAVHLGATRVVLLGYDCQRTNGLAHWHGNHPRGLGNGGAMARWAESFAELAQDMARRGVEVVNATRETALKCFPRVELEQALA